MPNAGSRSGGSPTVAASVSKLLGRACHILGKHGGSTLPLLRDSKAHGPEQLPDVHVHWGVTPDKPLRRSAGR